MALPLRGQALDLLKALCLGLALGLGYDLLRPPRRRCSRPVGMLLDILFALGATAVCFIGAAGAEAGRLGLWELSASLLGFLLYLHALSPLFLPVIAAGDDLLCRIIAWYKKIFEKLLISAKKNFQKVRKCFIVKR